MGALQRLKDIIRIDFDGVVIDYQVEYNLTGKVLSCRPLIFDLPLNGQRIIFGNREEEIKKEILAFQNIIPLIIPIGLQNQKTFFENELSTIYTTVNSHLKQKQLTVGDLYKLADSNSLEYKIHSSHSEPQKYTDDFHRIWNVTKELILNRNASISIDSLRFLGYYEPQIGFSIISLLVPFIKNSNIKRLAYESLQYCVTVESLEYLLKELDHCNDGQALSGIFKSLSKHKLKGAEIQDKVISIYNSSIQLSEDSKGNLMKVLKQFPNRQTSEVGLEIIKDNNRYSGSLAARSLLDIGCPAKRIADIVLPKLLAADPRESEAAFSILCNSDKFSSYLPDNNELLQVYVKILEVNQNLNIAYAMPSMIKRKYDHSSAEQIVNYLSYQNPNVLEGILILISCLMRESSIDTTLFYSEKTKQRYHELLRHKKREVVENTLRIMGRIGETERDEKYIDVFLDIINFDNNSLNNLYAMRAVNYILPFVKFNDRIINYYKKALESNNYNYRVEALRGLRFSTDDDLKKSLSYLIDDPSQEVRKVALNISKPPEKVRRQAHHVSRPSGKVQKPNWLINSLRYVYRKIKHKGGPQS